MHCGQELHFPAFSSGYQPVWHTDLLAGIASVSIHLGILHTKKGACRLCCMTPPLPDFDRRHYSTRGRSSAGIVSNLVGYLPRTAQTAVSRRLRSGSLLTLRCLSDSAIRQQMPSRSANHNSRSLKHTKRSWSHRLINDVRVLGCIAGRTEPPSRSRQGIVTRMMCSAATERPKYRPVVPTKLSASFSWAYRASRENQNAGRYS